MLGGALQARHLAGHRRQDLGGLGSTLLGQGAELVLQKLGVQAHRVEGVPHLVGDLGQHLTDQREPLGPRLLLGAAS